MRSGGRWRIVTASLGGLVPPGRPSSARRCGLTHDARTDEMTYALGIDLGTTYTAAAIWRAGSVEIVGLGTHSHVIPSVAHLRDDGQLVTGEAAVRRTVTEPGRTGREFKRRLGDPTPILLAGTPFAAADLMTALLRDVLAAVTE